MKTTKMLTILVLAMGLMVCLAEVSKAAPMGTAFTYQSRLMDKNKPADGLYDFQFKLYDSNDPCTGAQLGSTIDINDLDVVDGHFIVELDFGSGIFDGNAVWLETRVVHSPMGSDPAALSPLLELTPTPYALQTRGIFVDNVLNVGIGTTIPVGKLHVDGGKAMDGTLGADVVIKAQDGGDGWGMQNNGSAGGDIILLPGEGGEEYGVGFPGPDGNVGIGTSTPARKLEVKDAEAITRLTSDGSLGSRLELHNINEDPSTLGFIDFSHDPSGLQGQIAYSWDGMDFKTANVQRMRIDKDGNFGIGTTTPGGLLHLSSASGIDLVIEADTNNYGEEQNARVIMSQDGGLVSARVGYRESLNKLEIMQEYNDSLILGTDNTDRLTITGDGKVGIGTDSPYALLDVISSSSLSSLYVHNSSTYINSWFVVNNTSGGPAIFAVSNSGTNATVHISNSGGGKALKVVGTAEVSVLQIMGADLAEKFPVSEEVKPGMVMAIDPEHPGKLCLSRGAYNRCVAGVVSGANGLEAGAVLGNLPGQEDATPIALSGRVWVYCDATDHPVEAGDLLTTAERIGHAMAVTDYERAHGTVIGKAMTGLKNEKSGLVLALVNLQ